MTLSEILELVSQAGGELIPNGDKLVMQAPAPLPDDLRQAIRRHKSELLALLQGQAPEASDAAKGNPLDFEERAAIYEVDGGMTRAAAESLAAHGRVVGLPACERCNGMAYQYADGHIRCTTPWCQ